jgi:hypothetical protein
VGRKEELDNLIAAFDRAVHEKPPNTKRVGCPGRPALAAFAKESATFGSDSLLEHLRHCAVCLDELKQLRLTINRSQ